MVVIYYFQALAEPDPNPNALLLLRAEHVLTITTT